MNKYPFQWYYQLSKQRKVITTMEYEVDFDRPTSGFENNIDRSLEDDGLQAVKKAVAEALKDNPNLTEEQCNDLAQSTFDSIVGTAHDGGYAITVKKNPEYVFLCDGEEITISHKELVEWTKANGLYGETLSQEDIGKCVTGKRYGEGTSFIEKIFSMDDLMTEGYVAGDILGMTLKDGMPINRQTIIRRLK